MERNMSNLFEKLLKQMSGQLWHSGQLNEVLEDEAVSTRVPAECLQKGVHSHEELFELLVQNNLVSPSDTSLLSRVLKKHNQSHLLQPFSEVGFGQTGLGLRRNSGSDSARVEYALAATCGKKSPRRKTRCCRLKEFKELLHCVGSQINAEDLNALTFLCYDVMARCQLEQISSGLSLLTALRKRRCITAQQPEFLYRILQDCGRSDLSHFVDGYLKQKREAANGADFSSDDGDAVFGECLQRNYAFRRSLQQLGDRLGHLDLQSMKVVAGSCIPDSKLEKVRTVFDLFVILEDRGKLSADDLSFLEELLEDKLHLVHQLYKKGFGKKNLQISSIEESLPMHTVFTHEHLAVSFKKLLKSVGSRLTSADVEPLKFMCPDEIALGLSETIESGIDLLLTLEKRQVISATDVDFLLEKLESIGRKDLCTVVALYKHSQITRMQASNQEMQRLRTDAEPDFQRGPDVNRRHTGPADGSSSLPLSTAPSLVELEQLEESQIQLKKVEETLQAERLQHEKDKSQLQAQLIKKCEEYSNLLRKVMETQDKKMEKHAQKQQEFQELYWKNLQQQAQIAVLQEQLQLRELQLSLCKNKASHEDGKQY